MSYKQITPINLGVLTPTTILYSDAQEVALVDQLGLIIQKTTTASGTNLRVNIQTAHYPEDESNWTDVEDTFLVLSNADPISNVNVMWNPWVHIRVKVEVLSAAGDTVSISFNAKGV